MAESDGFLGRWARRKALAQQRQLPPEPNLRRQPRRCRPPTDIVLAGADGATLPAPEVATPPPTPAEPEPPAPTLADAQLRRHPDFRPFVARAVAPRCATPRSEAVPPTRTSA